mmetsp:Transcript_103822/g.294107  ORF Transcript_103822/g.294107 Transcript_103822/m.294107 type:complete len:187 (+) Transcript_103822:672-1232(+)
MPTSGVWSMSTSLPFGSLKVVFVRPSNVTGSVPTNGDIVVVEVSVEPVIVVVELAVVVDVAVTVVVLVSVVVDVTVVVVLVVVVTVVVVTLVVDVAVVVDVFVVVVRVVVVRVVVELSVVVDVSVVVAIPSGRELGPPSVPYGLKGRPPLYPQKRYHCSKEASYLRTKLRAFSNCTYPPYVTPPRR